MTRSVNPCRRGTSLQGTRRELAATSPSPDAGRGDVRLEPFGRHSASHALQISGSDPWRVVRPPAIASVRRNEPDFRAPPAPRPTASDISKRAVGEGGRGEDEWTLVGPRSALGPEDENSLPSGGEGARVSFPVALALALPLLRLLLIQAGEV
jgi:hypothetical protein